IEIHLAQTNTQDETTNTKLCTCNSD
mgnify:CR=1